MVDSRKVISPPTPEQRLWRKVGEELAVMQRRPCINAAIRVADAWREWESAWQGEPTVGP